MSNIAVFGLNRKVTQTLQRLLKLFRCAAISLEDQSSAKDMLMRGEEWSVFIFAVEHTHGPFVEFQGWLQEVPALAHVPRIYIIEPNSSAVVHGWAGREHVFLEKPFQKKVLLETIKKVSSSTEAEPPAKADEQLSGQTFGSTELEHEIGRGGMGTVYMGYQPMLNRRVAVKFVRSDAHTSIDYLKQLQAEAIAIAQLKNEHIVQVFEAGFAREDLFYITMEFLEGQNLFQYLLYHGKMSEVQAVEVLKQVAKGLAVAHKAKIVHRDIKPSNLIIDGEGHVTITDFGAAKSLNATQSDLNQHLTQAGVVLGTPHYFSPEQAMGQPLDERTDIYSLGIVFYELLTGSVPFDGATPLEAVLKRFNEPFPDPRDIAPSVSPELVEILFKMTQLKPDDRYLSCEDLLLDLDSIQSSDMLFPDTPLPGFVVDYAEQMELKTSLWNPDLAHASGPVDLESLLPDEEIASSSGPSPVLDFEDAFFFPEEEVLSDKESTAVPTPVVSSEVSPLHTPAMGNRVLPKPAHEAQDETRTQVMDIDAVVEAAFTKAFQVVVNKDALAKLKGETPAAPKQENPEQANVQSGYRYRGWRSNHSDGDNKEMK